MVCCDCVLCPDLRSSLGSSTELGSRLCEDRDSNEVLLLGKDKIAGLDDEVLRNSQATWSARLLRVMKSTLSGRLLVFQRACGRALDVASRRREFIYGMAKDEGRRTKDEGSSHTG